MHIRRAGKLDTNPMADLLNAIITKGGTTALTVPVTSNVIYEKMQAHSGASAWHIAEGDDGTLLGFQYIEPNDQLPKDACDIATFVRIGTTGLGVGPGLFEITKKAAKDLGYTWINANIRADNTGGLAYYQSRGFEDYKRSDNVELDNGMVVDKIYKRFDLTW